MEKLLDYLEKERIDFNVECEGAVEINGKTFELIYPKDGLLFDDEFHLICDETFCDNYIFNFGGKYYWTPKGSEKEPKLNLLKYIGSVKSDVKTHTFLGVRGGFELLNGSRLYSDWCKKAKFLGIKNLGICEKNTLAGVLKFQMECVKNGIKPIIGETISAYNEGKDILYDLKCYVRNEKGWENLLLINKEINVVNPSYIKEKDLFRYSEGLVMLLDPKSMDINDTFPFDLNFDDFYYQLDTAEFENEDRDEWYLKNLKKFYNSSFLPVSIVDAFYLDEEDYHIKKKLNLIKKANDPFGVNQYFKDKQQYFQELDLLFSPDTDDIFGVYEEAVLNEGKIAHKCNFTVDTRNRYLPKYEMTPEESSLYTDSEDMLRKLVKEGLEEKIDPSLKDEYFKRTEEELEVIIYGNVVDYFLITRDIVNWAKNNEILVGIGRGSAGGSLILYLLGITNVDPIEYGLLFSRFVNIGRIQVSLPDVDMDFSAGDRIRVKQYMEERFGISQVCSVGTYTALKLRGAIKDLSRLENIPFEDVNRVTLLIEEDDKTLEDLFKKATEYKHIKNFIHKYPFIINDLNLILGQPKAQSIHACAMMIFPKDKDMFRWSPIRIQDGIFVSEWEGLELDSAGFLKEDILGIKQLDKFKDIISLVKEHKGEEIDIYSLKYTDDEVYEYFCKGWNEDVFHFGSPGLTGYCKELQPTNIEDLIAAISLYRPGAMENNFHNEYILRKNGEREVEYFTGSESVLSDTYGVFVYQEQIMKLCQVLGGLTLVEADDVRKAMVKKKYEALHQYKDRFLKYYQETFNVTPEYADNVWSAIDKASTYLFNKSHATAYTITGYISQWLKVHYPLEYWITAFKYANEEDYSNYISEINKIGGVKVLSSDINKSGKNTSADFKLNTIYWPLTAIKQLGEIAAEQIIKDREENGEYFSFSEFLNRHSFKGSKVNKRIIENLILSGSFDEIEGIKKPHKRLELITQYYELNKTKRDEEKDLFLLNQDKLSMDWWWCLQQKQLSGIAFFEFENIVEEFIEDPLYSYYTPQEFGSKRTGNSPKATIIGYVISHEEKSSKKGVFCKIVLESNYDFINVIIWHDQYRDYEGIELGKKILVVNGVIRDDKGKNILISNTDTKLYVLD